MCSHFVSKQIGVDAFAYAHCIQLYWKIETELIYPPNAYFVIRNEKNILIYTRLAT